MPNLDRSLPFLPELPQFPSAPPKLPEPATGGPGERAERPAFLEFLQRRRRDQAATSAPPPASRPDNSARPTPTPRVASPPARSQTTPPEPRADETRGPQASESAVTPDAHDAPSRPTADAGSTAAPVPAPAQTETAAVEPFPAVPEAEAPPQPPAPHFQQASTGLVVPESFPQAFASFDTGKPTTMTVESTDRPIVRRVDAGRPQPPDGLLKTLYPESVTLAPVAPITAPAVPASPEWHAQAPLPESPVTVPAEIFTSQTAPQLPDKALAAPPLTAALGAALEPAAVSITPVETPEPQTQPVVLEHDGNAVRPALPKESLPTAPTELNGTPSNQSYPQSAETPLNPMKAAASVEAPAPAAPPPIEKTAPAVPTTSAVEQNVAPPPEIRSPEPPPPDIQPRPTNSRQTVEQVEVRTDAERPAVSPSANTALENCFAPPESMPKHDGEPVPEPQPRYAVPSVPTAPAANEAVSPSPVPNLAAIARDDALPPASEAVPATETIKPTAPRTESPAPLAREATQADARQLVDRVAKAVSRAAEQHNNKLQIRLHPPELGILTIEVTSREGAVVARLEVQSVAAQQTLMEHLPQLKDAIAHAGNHVDRIDVQLADPATDKGRSDADERGQRQQGGSEHSEHDGDQQQKRERHQQRGQERRPGQPASREPGNGEVPQPEPELPGSLMEGLNIQV